MGQQVSLPHEIRELLSRHKLLPKTHAERTVLQAVISGDEADCGPAGASDFPVDDLTKWSHEQTIRGSFMQGLIVHVLAGRRESTNRIDVSNARFTEQLDLSGLTLPALFLLFNHCHFDQFLDASDSHLLSLDLTGSWVPEFYAAALAVDKHLVLTSLQCPGKVDLSGAHVEGSLYAETCTLGNAPAPKPGEKDVERGFDGLNLYVGGNALFPGCNLTGSIYLYGATIGGTLDFGGAQIDGRGSYTVHLEKTAVQGNVLMTAIHDDAGKTVPFRSAGCVGITNSTIKNGIDATGGQLQLTKSPDEEVLCGLMVTFSSVQGSTKFGGGFQADGVSLRYSDFNVVDFDGGTVGALGLDLRSAKVREFIDRFSAWPKGKLQIGGFSYDKISDYTSPKEAAQAKKLKSEPADAVARRLYWIGLDSPPSPESYKQYAGVLTNEGNDNGAKQASEAGQRAIGSSGGVKEKTETLMMWPIGYGYAPENAIYGLLALTALGWIIYRRNFLAGRITPTECDAYTEYKEKGITPAHYTRFSPLVYSLENTFPLVNLGQAAKWQPDPSMKVTEEPPVANTSGEDMPHLQSRHHLWATQVMARRMTRQLRVFLWVQILVGWVLATLFIAAIGGLVRK